MTNWHEDKNCWLTMDKVLRESACNIHEMLDAFEPYESSMDRMVNTLLFGALGKFALAYEKLRQEGVDPPMSFHGALVEISNDPRVNAMMQSGINNIVDQKVGDIF